MKQIDYCGRRVILTYMRDITSKVKQKLQLMQEQEDKIKEEQAS